MMLHEREIRGPAREGEADALWRDHFAAHRAAAEATERDVRDAFAAAADRLAGTLAAGGTVMFCGNGGSAADAQHLAAELTVRFLADRPALRSIALSSDYSALTACGNDLGFDRIFARQVEALGRPGDAIVALTTSGNSPNVVAALEEAKSRRMTRVLMTGPKRGAAVAHADVVLAVPASATAQIQEMHITIGHALCKAIEKALGYGS
jgi:D-sedoheptulose 7-phosphate isomerase